MYRYDKERIIKIGELVTTVKLISLIFFIIAVLIEIPKYTYEYSFFNFHFSSKEFVLILGNLVILLLLSFSIIIIRYYQGRYNSQLKSKKQTVYDIIELLIFLSSDTLLIVTTGLNASPYKIIFFFIMISVTIQHGLKYGIALSSVCSAIVLAVDIIAVKQKPNPDFQIDLILAGVFLMITWLVGYYRNVEAQYSEKMVNIAITDDLTGLYSHGYFQHYLKEQITEAKGKRQPLSLMFIDIDYFKYFNDLYGHQTGDMVLKEMGAKIKQHLHSGYLAARYGGEEFTVIMSDTTEEEAVAFAEKLRKEIEEEFTNRFAAVSKITVSIGVSSFPSKAKDKEELIKYADDALYRAKSFHKNRVETYHSVLEELKNDIEDDDIEIISSMKTLISIINTKDRYTYRHIERVVLFCGLIADALNLSPYEKKILKYSAYLHDIGKINIPQEILNKKMPLSNEEWELLKQHPSFGVDILAPVKSLADVIPIILHHHERYDGNGYPHKLSGEDIPYLARILTAADSFDAMTSNRPYCKAKTFDEGIQELSMCASSQFDPKIVNVFTSILKRKKVLF